MKVVNIHAAKTNLSRLIRQACEGEEIVIARGKEPVVRLVPIVPRRTGRVFGAYRDRISFDDGFFDPLPEEELAAWEGRE